MQNYKDVMFSIHPKNAADILNGKKTILIRATKPTLEPPFKGYIYCTKASKEHQTVCGCMILNDDQLFKLPSGKIKYGDSIELLSDWSGQYDENNFLNGKVVGEFICNSIVEYEMEGYDKDADVFQAIFSVEHDEEYDDDFYTCEVTNEESEEEQLSTALLRESCLSFDDIGRYVCGEDKKICFHTFFGLHLSDVKVYDKPKNLSEFYIPCYSGCKNCNYHSIDSSLGIKESVCTVSNRKPIKRPPSSWCYVGERKYKH